MKQETGIGIEIVPREPDIETMPSYEAQQLFCATHEFMIRLLQQPGMRERLAEETARRKAAAQG